MLIKQTSLRDFFHTSIHDALQNQHIEADDHTVVYIVNLLTIFARSENLFEDTEDGLRLKSLADHYSSALNASSTSQQYRHLQRLGDIALFISGFFADSITKKNIDIDYYISMGGNAYSYLSSINNMPDNPRVYRNIFQELADKFINFVDIIAEVGEQTNATTDADILRQYEIWLKTGSKRAEKLLWHYGINVNSQSGLDNKH